MYIRKSFYILFFTVLFLLQGCKPAMYSVTYKNVTEKEVSNASGIWGDVILGVGAATPMGGGGTNGALEYDIPKKAGARWTNAAGEEIEFLVEIDQSKFPEIDTNHEDYEFIFEIRQNDIRQVELVVHDHRPPNLDKRRRKVMLYCGESECYFNSPFTTDEYYSPRQLENPKLQEYLRKQKAVFEKMEKALEEGSEVKPE